MTAPYTLLGSPTLDPLLSPAGTLTAPNWTSPARGRAAGLTVTAGVGATAPVDGTLSASQWAVGTANAYAAYVQMAALPVGVGHVVRVGFYFSGGIFMFCEYAPDTQLVTQNINGATDSVSFTPDAGSWLGITHISNASSDSAITGWFKRSTAGAWDPSLPLCDGCLNLSNFGGMFAFIETNDATTRLRNFGCGDLPSASVTAPVVHGHGAC